ncbi:hypothetical protein [Allopontixanthobacter sp.]|uniref:hypothetical protein n=1 Tax=Allopontixanthobacter sp. TaxID=2906452 RepID=UPI002ABC80FB|nr:hypothetical protein [Allopontixanthobacter sp.]MDZ4308782.1 hypothetical protein [Allopontixanthobacter sp.]
MTSGPIQIAARNAAIVAALSLASAPVQAQFSGLKLPSPTAPTAETSPDGCPKGKKKGFGSSLLGSVVGKAAGDAAYRAGVSRWLPMAQVSDQLTNAIACRLDPEEQVQAAEATLAATRAAEDGTGAQVGSSASWKSNTREDVSGSSTVVGRNDDEAASLECITVTDVIIVRGEETTANKRMCRPPGSARYSLAA